MDAMSGQADLILHSGRVFDSVAGAVGPATAVAISGNRILAVGGDSEVRALAGPRCESIDLRGRVLVPGLIDAHCHFQGWGLAKAQIDLKAPGIRSLGDVARAVRERAAGLPPGSWVRGRGYDQGKLREGRHPDRDLLDAAAPEHPVVLTRTCGHIAAVNSRALAAMGVDERTPDPPGGRFGRRPGDGRLDGILYETAQRALQAALPPPTEEERLEAIVAASRDYLSFGVTSVHDAGGAEPALMQRARAQGRLLTRVYLMQVAEEGDTARDDALAEIGLVTGFGDDWLRIGPFKLFADGSSSGPTAATREPYAVDPGSRGILRITQEEADRRYAAAHARGMQVTAHAQGDHAIDIILTAIERAMAAHPRPDPRHRIEHAGIAQPDLVARMAAAGVIPVAQPVFVYEFGEGYVRDYGPRRGHRFMPCRAFLEAGVPVALSSDAPVTTADALFGLEIAVTRRSQGGPAIGADQALTWQQALVGYTWNAARAAFEEDRKGAIAPGYLADLAVLSGEPPRFRADLTVVDGRVAYERAGAD
jgi:predicted amidohydrolase YtcJ